MGPRPSEESLCCPACPAPPPFFSPILGPRSLKLCISFPLYLLSTCMYHTFSHITFLGYNHIISRASIFLDSLLSEHRVSHHPMSHVSLGEAPSQSEKFLDLGSHATTLQHLRARKLVRRTRSVHSRTRAPAKLVSTTKDFRAFVAKTPHLTIPRQRTLVYGGKLLFSNASAKIPKAISQKRHDGFSFLNDGNLDKCLSKKKSRLATPALWLSSPH